MSLTGVKANQFVNQFGAELLDIGLVLSYVKSNDKRAAALKDEWKVVGIGISLKRMNESEYGCNAALIFRVLQKAHTINVELNLEMWQRVWECSKFKFYKFSALSKSQVQKKKFTVRFFINWKVRKIPVVVNTISRIF